MNAWKLKDLSSDAAAPIQTRLCSGKEDGFVVDVGK
jgi:hypothetical protein